MRGPRVAAVAVTATAAATVAAAVAGFALAGGGRSSVVRSDVLVGWGVPAITALAAAAAALTIGALVLTATVLPARPGPARQAPRADPAGLRLVAVAAATWASATVVQAGLEYRRAPAGSSTLADFLLRDDPGRGLVLTAVVAGLVAVVAGRGCRLTGLGWLTVISLVPLVAAAVAGSPVDTVDRDTAVTARGLQLLALCVWAGSLAGLLVVQGRVVPGGDAFRPISAHRWARLAGWAAALAVLSGVIEAVIRVPRAADLRTGYGLVAGVDVVGVCGLAVLALASRRRLLGQLDDGRATGFVRLATAELTLLGVLIGLDTALTVAPAPAGRLVRSPAESLSGYPLPPRLAGGDWFTQWQPDLLWLLVAGVAAVAYLVAAHRLRARGDHWSVPGTISWLVGLLILVYVTSGPPAVYGRVLFSLHMLGHMTLSMLAPVFLVLAAPATLALRALPHRRDDTWGPREWLMVALESRIARVLSLPPVAAFLFAGSLLFFYYSPLFEVALTTHVGLELMYAHFLLAGYLFAWVLVGLDPGPTRVPQPLRLITLLAAMAFHAFFGVALLSGSTVLAADYFGRLGRTWGAGLLTDQRLGGGIAWGIGDFPAIVMAIILAIQWSRDDEREARRLDRAADRDGGAELIAYNAMLARLAGTPDGGDDGPGPEPG